MKEGVIGYKVVAVDLIGQVKYEQDFYLKDFADAFAKANHNCHNIAKTFLDCSVYMQFIWGAIDHSEPQPDMSICRGITTSLMSSNLSAWFTLAARSFGMAYKQSTTTNVHQAAGSR